MPIAIAGIGLVIHTFPPSRKRKHLLPIQYTTKENRNALETRHGGKQKIYILIIAATTNPVDRDLISPDGINPTSKLSRAVDEDLDLGFGLLRACREAVSGPLDVVRTEDHVAAAGSWSTFADVQLAEGTGVPV